MKYCSKCGNPMEDDMLFCQQCGTKFIAPVTKEQLIQDTATVLNAAVDTKKTTTPAAPVAKEPKPKKRFFMKAFAVINFVVAAIMLLATLTGEPTLVSAFLTFGTLGAMFLILSKSPRTSKYLFGKDKGLRKGLFVLICIALVFVFIGTSGDPCEHEYELTDTINASCTEDGKYIYVCKLCEREKMDKIEATDHQLIGGKCAVCGFVEDADNSTIQNSQGSVVSIPDFVISADTLISEINSDIDAAKEKYNGKTIEITGEITYISESAGMTGYYLCGERGGEGLKITCWVYEEKDPSISIGDTITFSGTMREVTLVNNTEIGECTIVPQPTMADIESWYVSQIDDVGVALSEYAPTKVGNVSDFSVSEGKFFFGNNDGWIDCYYTVYFTCKVGDVACTGEARAFREYKSNELHWFHFEIVKDSDWSIVIEEYDDSYDVIIEEYYNKLEEQTK